MFFSDRKQNQDIAEHSSAKKRRRKGRSCIMKKIILALVVVLLATPAWASVAVTVTDIGNRYR
jgi:hypothetical protein